MKIHQYKLSPLRTNLLCRKKLKTRIYIWRKLLFLIFFAMVVLYYAVSFREIRNSESFHKFTAIINKTLLKLKSTSTTVLKYSSSASKSKVQNIKALKKFIKPTKYFVQTENCKIPWIDPFSVQVNKLFHPEKFKQCVSDKDLVKSDFDVKQRRYILRHNFTEKSGIRCCYQEIKRSGIGVNADNQYSLSPCMIFPQNFVVPLYIDFIITTCASMETNEIIQQDAFSFIQDRTNTTLDAYVDLSNYSSNKPNVFLIGIDSLSRINFRRNMPNTAEYLSRNKWFELEGYNKIGDNTFPNLIALLSGMDESMVNTKCKPDEVGGLDNCTYIWNDFKQSGYWTAYAEDLPFMNTFNYLKTGFLRPPTDYYLRPMLLAIEQNMPSTEIEQLLQCIGRRHSANYIYDFCVEFSKRLSGNSKFGLFWTNSFSHDYFSSVSALDTEMHLYFEKLEKSGIMENSIILFFSDHGMRWGPLLRLPEGFLEERLPMFFIWLPRKFREIHPELVRALEVNKNRLTTPFDIYQTLKHILTLETSNTKHLEPAISCPNARSVFNVIPETRTCVDACIPEHWCACTPYEVLSNDNPHVNKATELIIDEINNYLTVKLNFSSLCHTLNVNFITNAEVKIGDPKDRHPFEVFRITFSVIPNDVTFQATAFYDRHKSNVTVKLEDISRFDSYAMHSYCIDEKLAKKFCMCRH